MFRYLISGRAFGLLLFSVSLVCSCLWAVQAQDELQGFNPLEPVKTDSPRDTMATYLEAMDDYLRGRASGDKQLLARLDDAVRCFDLGAVTIVSRKDQGRDAAILLKEVIDRMIRIDVEKIPVADDSGNPLDRWRLRKTEITIVRIGEGERKGEYLFSSDTVSRLPEFYERVRGLPYLPGLKGAAYDKSWLQNGMPEWAKRKVILFPNWQWIGLFLAILLGLILKALVQYGLGMFKRVAEKSRHRWDNQIIEAVERPAGVVAAGILWLFAIYALKFETTAFAVLNVAVQVVVGTGLIWACYCLADVLAEYLGVLTDKTESTLDDQLVPLVRKAMKIFIVIFGALVVIQNMGVNVLSLLAGLGLGGLAFALAARDTCANLFGSIMILLDRPFQIGDWVIAGGGVEGTVEEIGFRSTRIRTFYDSVLSVPNAAMANANIDNMGRRRYRRIKAFFGVAYDTPPEKLEAFLEGIKNIVKANPYTRKEGYHVVFNSYESSCLNIMLYCFLKVPDWSMELVARQNVYLEVHRLAHDLGVEFAFPTQTLHVASTPENPYNPSDYDRDDLMSAAVAYGSGGKASMPNGQGIFVAPCLEASQSQPPQTLRGEAGE